MEIVAAALSLIALLVFLSHIFNIFEWFIAVGSVTIMIVSLGMFFNILSKKRDAEKERLLEEIKELETQLGKKAKREKEDE
ncbi:hypothetical protein KAX97_12415 [candidate division WOR-3 bacterium]|jgi:predicted tellurium resistance membrane protein TerC|nr:hypothetical protein [candidate division WOR-3 bacterium]